MNGAHACPKERSPPPIGGRSAGRCPRRAYPVSRDLPAGDGAPVGAGGPTGRLDVAPPRARPGDGITSDEIGPCGSGNRPDRRRRLVRSRRSRRDRRRREGSRQRRIAGIVGAPARRAAHLALGGPRRRTTHAARRGDPRRRARRQRRNIEAEAEIAAGVMDVGEVGGIGGWRVRDPGADAHRRAQLVVAARQSQRMRPDAADEEDEREQHHTDAGEPAQVRQPSSSPACLGSRHHLHPAPPSRFGRCRIGSLRRVRVLDLRQVRHAAAPSRRAPVPGRSW